MAFAQSENTKLDKYLVYNYDINLKGYAPIEIIFDFRCRIHNKPEQCGILPAQELFRDEISCFFIPWAFQHNFNSINHKFSFVLLQICDDMNGSGILETKMAYV